MTEQDWYRSMEMCAASEEAARATRWARINTVVTAAVLLLLIYQMLR